MKMLAQILFIPRLTKKITVNISYPGKTSTYDRVGSIEYYYSNDGYLQKRVETTQSGKLFEHFQVDRDDMNNLKRVILDEGYPDNLKDTFDFTFRDSVSIYKIMSVNTSYRFPSVGIDIKTVDDFTFSSQNFISRKGWAYSGPSGTVGRDGVVQSYDSFNRLVSIHSPDNSSSETYSYENSSAGLDSLYAVLGGKDGVYLSTFDLWPAKLYDHEFDFMPLWVILSTSEGSVDGAMHKYGALAEKKSLPANVIFSFQNKYDTNNRIVETKIINKSALYGTYKISY